MPKGLQTTVNRRIIDNKGQNHYTEN